MTAKYVNVLDEAPVGASGGSIGTRRSPISIHILHVLTMSIKILQSMDSWLIRLNILGVRRVGLLKVDVSRLFG